MLKSLREYAIAGLCAMQLGVSERSLEMTAAYSRERVQFDRAIGSFQAVHQRAHTANSLCERPGIAGIAPPQYDLDAAHHSAGRKGLRYAVTIHLRLDA